MKHFPRFLIAFALVASAFTVGGITFGDPGVAADRGPVGPIAVTEFYAAQTQSCLGPSVIVSTDDINAPSIRTVRLQDRTTGDVLDGAGPFAVGETYEVSLDLAPWINQVDEFLLVVFTNASSGSAGIERIEFGAPGPCDPPLDEPMCENGPCDPPPDGCPLDPCDPPADGCRIQGQIVATVIPTIECEALYALYKYTAGHNWTEQGGWATAIDPCTWDGVTCSDTNVISIILNNNNLRGALPPEIGDFAELERLMLYKNKIISAPPELGKLTKLRALHLEFNQLTAIPSEIGNLTNLYAIDLADNRLTTLPESFGNLTQLRELFIENNQLTVISKEIGNLTNLKRLWVNDNQLTALPPQLGRLTNLQSLFAYNNQLTALPPQLGNLTNLRQLRVQANQLTDLPPQLGNLAKLSHLYLHENQLAGTVGNPKDISIPLGQLTDTLRNLSIKDGTSPSTPWNNCLTVNTQQLQTQLDDLNLDWDECQP